MLELLACPLGGGELGPNADRGDELICRECDATFPVLAGIPILVPDAAAYVAEYRTALVASLAEYGLFTEAVKATLERWAGQIGRVSEALFDDDATPDERQVDAAVAPALETDDEDFRAFYERARTLDPTDALLSLYGRDLGRCVVMGVGVGSRLGTVQARSESVLAVDRSFPALLAARGAHPEASMAVMDAEQPALRDAGVDAIVAEALVDVLGDPMAFLEAAHRALVPRGALLLSTPDPALGMEGGPSAVLSEATEALGYRVLGRLESLPWLRVHGPRELQVFFLHLLALTRG